MHKTKIQNNNRSELLLETSDANDGTSKDDEGRYREKEQVKMYNVSL